VQDEILSKFDLTYSNFAMLSFIAALPGISQKNLAEYMDLNANGIVTGLDDLVSKGLINRARKHADRGKTGAEITRRGRQILAAAEIALSRHSSSIQQACSNAGISDLSAILGSVA